MNNSSWQHRELICLILYALVFYVIIIRRSLHLSHDHYGKLYGLRPGWIGGWYNDVSDAQWRNFHANLPILTVIFGIFTMVANMMRAFYHLKAKGMSIVWLLISSAYLSYLHGACIIFVLSIAVVNFLLVKIFGKKKYFPFVLWGFNISVLICNRVFEGYRFSSIGQHWAYLDNFRGTFRWHICFNFVTLRQISFGYDYHWACCSSRLDQKKHIQSCPKCSSGQTCYLLLQERNLQNNNFSLAVYLCYLVYAPLYIAGPVLSFNAFASQLDTPQKNYSLREVAWYGLRWVFSLLLMELMTHLFYYNAFAISGLWKQLSPMDVFIIGYGVLNFMWLKFSLIWRYFRFWSLISGIEAPENMPKCINNCYNLNTFWKSWHASFNKWLVRYMYIPLGGSQRKLLNVWVIFTFVAIWHDLEWKLLSWAWLTCVFFVPEMIVKSAATSFQAPGAFGEFVFRELSALAGAITITCLMVANLVGYVIGPSGMNWLISQFLRKEGLPTLGGMFLTFYVGTKLMFHIRDTKQRKD
ncbi:membrane-bound O-acyltransferase gup1-like isoform X1 [Rhododendron vialii]|uniref:membrane-bound O-acyltransferase gup1-like isoform X1 n=2 Tax=Rhododendron vialii TaxID=182163 RepID=UPI00265FBBE8|nr:membrane-bound O-acyltransferase gup1-like isoform X1 [Rhododendron vialii]XP_058189327.1 membrane-bound O-acyltransferase gup1-like isoform X1 [Rhododendron vialii]XP_058189332.1 membrane-bound O-acyltransferase gup1-like isoform X1 [Rhododendron vialii]XP_058189335.1 membrane-bound O-acyltransferase gup1-like isoform X1 [Rhododendron vialii]